MARGKRPASTYDEERYSLQPSRNTRCFGDTIAFLPKRQRTSANWLTSFGPLTSGYTRRQKLVPVHAIVVLLLLFMLMLTIGY